jgi:hypothetical protein
MLAAWGWQYVGAVSGRPHCWVHARATSSLSAHLTPRSTLLVLSTSTPLRAWTRERPVTHSAFAVYAAVSHRGDMRAAARALAGLGYGAPAFVRASRRRTGPPSRRGIRSDDRGGRAESPPTPGGTS